MILIHNKDFNNLCKETEEELRSQGFSTTPGSIAKLFADIINKNISGFYDTLSINHIQAFVTTATGEYLDSIGTLLNCIREMNEVDEDYRKRICNQTLSMSKANETAIRLAVLSCDGVDDVVLKKYSHGPGSLTVIPICKRISENNISQVEMALSDVVSFGEKLVVKNPILKYIKMSISLTFTVSADDTIKQSIAVGVRQAVIKYINSLKVGDTFIINELTQRIMEVDDRIIDYGCSVFKVNNQNCLYINQGCRWDEKFVISPDANAITVL